MVDSKEDYKFDLGVKGLNCKPSKWIAQVSSHYKFKNFSYFVLKEICLTERK